MAKRKLRGAEHRRRATPNVDRGRQSAERLARIFIRRRNAMGVLPSPDPQKNWSSDSSSSDGQSSSQAIKVVFRFGLNSNFDDLPKFISFDADDGDIDSSDISKIIGLSVDHYVMPLVQDKEPIFNLEQEMASHHLQDKIKELQEKYKSFRRVRGDGNCFFRAFKFAYLEHMLLMNDVEEANRILAKIEEFKYRILLENLTPSETLMNDYEAFRDIVRLISSSSENYLSHAVLLEWSKVEDGYSDPAIRFLRMVISSEIRKRPNHFEQSIQGLSCDTTMTVKKFCEIEVEPMGKDVDNVQISAFVDALGVPIRIEYVDDSKHKLNHYDLGIEASKLEKPYITLLYRPGHYDILYTKDYHMLVPEPVEVDLKDSEMPKKESGTVAKDPLTSHIDPIQKDEDMHAHPLITYIRRKQKGHKDHKS